MTERIVGYVYNPFTSECIMAISGSSQERIEDYVWEKRMNNDKYGFTYDKDEISFNMRYMEVNLPS